MPDYLPMNTPSLLPLFNPVDPDPSGGTSGNSNPKYSAGTKNAATGYSNATGDPAKGSNLNLDIVRFVGVQVTYVSGKLVYAEPSAVMPPGGIFGSITPADSSATTFYGTFAVPTLTRPGG